ncbi:kinase-like domain-containing protein [Sporodiniella umbellata]|nr:kinase-like domain-containing protein [Sporodiniella umbellata]
MIAHHSEQVKPILVNSALKNRSNSLKLSTHNFSIDANHYPASPQPVWNMEDFEINQPIGYGSSATVYSAIYKPHHKKVAIKVINLDRFERNQIDELRRETTLMALSKHSNILQVYGSFVHGSKLYIVTPYMSVGSCLDIIKTTFPDGLDEASIATILKQVLEGLAYLHKNGHIHRDVKAGNLLMDQDGTVRLADFGVSSSLMETGVRRTFVGTPCWMAPEVMEQEEYDYKADIWSFGITAIELATGRAPFAKLPPLKVLMLTLSREPPTLCRESSVNKYSKSFKEMIDMCMNKTPSKRLSSEKLLQHPFFKQAKKPEWLVKNLIPDLPTIDQRPVKCLTEKTINDPTTDEWDFGDSQPKKHISFGQAIVKGHAGSKRALSVDFRVSRQGRHQHQASAPSVFPIFQDPAPKTSSEKPSLVTFSEEKAIDRKTLYRTMSQEKLKKPVHDTKCAEFKKAGLETKQQVPLFQINQLLSQNDAQRQLLLNLYSQINTKDSSSTDSVVEALEHQLQAYQRENHLLQRENQVMRKQIDQLLKK